MNSRMTTQGNNQSEILDDFSIRAVSENKKCSAFQITLVTAGYCMTTSGLLTGASISIGLTILQSIVAAFIGNTLLALYAGLIGAASAKHGVSTIMLARHAFGRYGAKIVSAVNVFVLIGWYAVQTNLFGKAFSIFLPNFTWVTSQKIAALGGGLLMMVTAYIGFRGLELISKIAIPSLILLSIWGIYATVGQFHDWNFLLEAVPSHPFSLTEGIVLTVGSFAGGAVVQADISRYARSPKDSWIACLIGCIIGNSFMIIAGVLTTMATGSGDLLSAMVAIDLAIPSLVILVAAQWTTNDNNLYSASLALSNIFKCKKSILVLWTGIFATFLSMFDITDYFIPWLNALGIVIPPISGVMIADYYIINKKKYFFGNGTQYSKFIWPAFLAWALGILTAVFLPIGIPSLTAILATFLSYIVLVLGCEQLQVPSKLGIVIEDSEGF